MKKEPKNTKPCCPCGPECPCGAGCACGDSCDCASKAPKQQSPKG